MENISASKSFEPWNKNKLGSSHKQNAIVWIGADGVPELILLR